MTTGFSGKWEIDLEIDNDEIVFTCPRCFKRQSQKLTSEILNWGMYCENIEVCGEGNVKIDFNWSVSGYYKDHGDIPLNG